MKIVFINQRRNRNETSPLRFKIKLVDGTFQSKLAGSVTRISRETKVDLSPVIVVGGSRELEEGQEEEQEWRHVAVSSAGELLPSM